MGRQHVLSRWRALLPRVTVHTATSHAPRLWRATCPFCARALKFGPQAGSGITAQCAACSESFDANVAPGTGHAAETEQAAVAESAPDAPTGAASADIGPPGDGGTPVSTPHISEVEELDLAIAMSLEGEPVASSPSSPSVSIEPAPRVDDAIAEEQAVLAQSQMEQSDLMIALLLSEEDAARGAAAEPERTPPPVADQRDKTCAICMDRLRDPVPAGQCMHLFCRACILGWVPAQGEQVCPTCREETFSRQELRSIRSFRLPK